MIAAAILRHLHAVVTTGQAWDPAIATHGTRRTAGDLPTRRLTRRGGGIKLTVGASPTRH